MIDMPRLRAALDGGMSRWAEAGAPVNTAEGSGWTIERQVRLTAGSGLVVAALTDSCWMGRALMRMPWNTASSADVDRALADLAA